MGLITSWVLGWYDHPTGQAPYGPAGRAFSQNFRNFSARISGSQIRSVFPVSLHPEAHCSFAYASLTSGGCLSHATKDLLDGSASNGFEICCGKGASIHMCHGSTLGREFELYLTIFQM
jgi:hypothetical protein